MPEGTRLDPWGRAQVADYAQLIRDFGIEPFEPLLGRVSKPMRLMKRSIIFGHRDYGRVLEAMAAKKPFGVISGFMPSGRAHLGAKMVMEEIVWHQQMGGDATVAIADMEAHAVRGISWEKCREWGIHEYVLSLIALGLEPDRAKVYFQSENRQVQDLAFQLAKEAKFGEMKTIYGFADETTLAHMLCPTIQAADILAPQLQENGGPRPLVVPVGVDQDPHIRLTREIVVRVSGFQIEDQINRIVVRPRVGSVRPLDIDLRPGGYVSQLNLMPGIHTTNYVSHVEVFGATLEQVREVMAKYVAEHPEYGPSSYVLKKRKDHVVIEPRRSAIDLRPEGYVAQLNLSSKVETKNYPSHVEVFGATIEQVREVMVKYITAHPELGFFSFVPPASLYHRFMSGLTGGKMSSSVPESHIALSEPPQDAEAKVLKAKTGGRVTEKEQRERGGEPEKCTVYELMQYNLDDGTALKDMRDLCVSGKRLCGPCKKWAAGEMGKILAEHREKRGEAEGRLDEFGLKRP